MQSRIVVALATLLLARMAFADPGVLHLDARSVDAAFSKGAVLFDGDGANYGVHASRREAPGEAEIHEKDADVIHVLSGSATFVTGGTVIAGRNVAPDEIRGSGIEGGQIREIRAGDVLVVPHGVPHWFREVRGPVTYFVVKVR